MSLNRSVQKLSMVFDALSVNIYQACADPEPFFQSSGKGWKGCLRFPLGGWSEVRYIFSNLKIFNLPEGVRVSGPPFEDLYLAVMILDIPLLFLFDSTLQHGDFNLPIMNQLSPNISVYLSSAMGEASIY